MIKSLQYNWSYVLLIILTILSIFFSFRGCDKPKEYSQEYVDSLVKSKDSAVAVAMEHERRFKKATEQRDSIVKVGEKLKEDYNKKTRPERIVIIERIIGPVDSDSSGIRITYDQLDSINLIVIDRDICESIVSKADEQIAELFGATTNYKLALNKSEEVNGILKVKVTELSNSNNKYKKKTKRNRKIAIGVGIVAIGQAAILYLKR